MARVSLILPAASDAWPDPVRVDSLKHALEGAGHEIEVIVATDLATNAPAPLADAWRVLKAGGTGQAAAAVEGLLRAEGELLVVLDLTLGYRPEDLVKVVEPLVQGRADLVVASRAEAGDGLTRPRQVQAWVGALVRPLTGTSDPLSGLIGLRRELVEASGVRFRAVGSKFSFELLAKLGGRWVDVPVRPLASSRSRRPEFADLRHLKHLADHRFGNLSRLIQFCAVGGSGMIVDLTCYFLLQRVFGNTALADRVVPPTQITVALALARSLSIAVALVWNFSLNRRLTFSYARSGSIARQFVTYVLSNALGVGLSLALSLGLPRVVPFFNDHKLVAAVVGIVAATGVSFSMARWVVFHGRAGLDAHEPSVHSPHHLNASLIESTPVP
jgi:dolichol-phosphate mannosyltransferase